MARYWRQRSPAPRRRRRLRPGGIAVVMLLVPVGLLTVLFAVLGDDPAPGSSREPDPPAPSRPAGGGRGPADAGRGAAEWNLAAQAALATRPMPQLPEAAAWPHALAAGSTQPPIVLPPAGELSGVVPSGFPATVDGAVAQLVALTRVGLEGGDPQTYRHAYESVALPGAPAVEATRLHRDLARVRARVVGFPRTGPVPGLVFSWSPTSALVKGTTDADRYTVVCVLGELVTGVHGQSVSSGAGDCQALRRVGDQWRISPGPAAAPASPAWPGSPEAEQVGYREVR